MESMSSSNADAVPIFQPGDIDRIRSKLSTKKANLARLISCIFWSLTKFQRKNTFELLRVVILKAVASEELRVAILKAAQQELEPRTTLKYDFRLVIMHTGLLLPKRAEEKAMDPLKVTEWRWPVGDLSSGTVVKEVLDFLKEMARGVISKANSDLAEYITGREQISSGLPIPSREEPYIKSFIAKELNLLDTEAERFDLQTVVKKISSFTTVDEHRQYFRKVMGDFFLD